MYENCIDCIVNFDIDKRFSSEGYINFKPHI